MRLLRCILFWTAAALVAFYAADYLVARKQPRGSVEVQPYYAVPQRDGKTEFLMLDPEVDSCVNSLLPHLGLSPCWYLKKHTQKKIQL